MQKLNLSLLALAVVAGLSIASTADAHRNKLSDGQSMHAPHKTATKHRRASVAKGWCPMRQIRKHYQGRIAFRCS